MKTSDEFRSGRHVVFMLHAHLVFTPKYRKKIFESTHLSALETYARKVCEDMEVELVEFNGEPDHVHLLVNYPPKLALSNLVNSLKGVTSRLLRKDFPEIERYYWKKKTLWSRSYFVSSCGGAPLEILKQYIQDQDRPE
jgi:putative transposase